MTRICILLLFALAATGAFSARIYPATTYLYTIDLRQLHNDQVRVTLDFTPGSSLSVSPPEAMIFCLPKIVPGIYGAMNFGQNLTAMEAFDHSGQSLGITQLDVNRWKIGGTPSKVTYYIHDGWEEFNTFKDGYYLSAESAFQENKAFVINHNTLFGYFEGYEERRIDLQVHRPEEFYGATSLNKPRSTETTDFYSAQSYRSLVDNPILYARPDTTRFQVGGAEIMVAMYAANGQKLSKEIAAHIRPLLENQKAYLGGKLPVDRYTFLLYYNENPDQYSALGDGLEHSNSTLILMYMPYNTDMIKRNVYGIASHEFLHTLLPLSLHSEEIGHYNFNSPVLSKHIWLYEGTTEYFTLHMPIVQKAETMDEFLGALELKFLQMKDFSNERSLTYLSEHAIDNQADYYNFYLKGALVNLCLDIRLRELSKGKYGLRDLVSDLMKVYGESKPFKDDALFAEMARVSGYPQIKTFLEDHVSGTKVPPYGAYLMKAGIRLDEASGKLTLIEKPSRSQLALRKAWIGQ